MKQHVKTSSWVIAVLILSGIAAAAHQPSQKHLKRSVCLEQCAAEIAAKCVPHHHFHQCRGTLIRACQHQKPGVCVATTTTTAPSSATTTTTTPRTGGRVLKGALPPTLGRFNFNSMLGLPGANAACSTNFSGTHACTYAELQSAQAAGDLVELKDISTPPMAVTSFWAIDNSQPPLQQCNDDAPGTGSGLNWEYGTAHTASRGQKVSLDNGAGTLGALQSSQQCALLGTPAWVGCCQ
jgi:hypothetical protein